MPELPENTPAQPPDQPPERLETIKPGPACNLNALFDGIPDNPTVDDDED